jgi:uridine kinase
MIGDKLIYHSSYQKINGEIISKLKTQFSENKRICIAVGGESGSGKTSLAFALLKDIETELGLKGFLFHADDYFYLPPKDNHNKRLEDISNVGNSEVNLNLLDEQVFSFLEGKENLEKPLVNYSENSIGKETIHPKDFDFCIVEGTYVMLLKQPSFKVFIENSFEETRSNRIKRAREISDNFNDEVLKIEHEIIKKHIKHADFSINNKEI